MVAKSAAPLLTMRRSSCKASRPWMPTPLLPASVKVRTMSRPRSSAYRWMAACWFSVEYCCCSVDMRTYSAARIGPDGAGRDGRLRYSEFIATAQGGRFASPPASGYLARPCARTADQGNEPSQPAMTPRRSQPAGQSGIQALQPECHREHYCGGGTCVSGACERMEQM